MLTSESFLTAAEKRLDLAFGRRWEQRFLRMDARDDSNVNPFSSTLHSLEWISSAIDAARRHTARESERRGDDEPARGNASLADETPEPRF